MYLKIRNVEYIFNQFIRQEIITAIHVGVRSYIPDTFTTKGAKVHIYSHFGRLFRPVLHLLDEEVAALPGDDAEAAVDEEDEVLRVVVDVEAEAVAGDDVPRRPELDVEAALDGLAQLGGVPARLLAGVQHHVQHLVLF